MLKMDWHNFLTQPELVQVHQQVHKFTGSSHGVAAVAAAPGHGQVARGHQVALGLPGLGPVPQGLRHRLRPRLYLAWPEQKWQNNEKFAGPPPRACQIMDDVLMTLQIFGNVAIQANSKRIFERKTRTRAIIFGT